MNLIIDRGNTLTKAAVVDRGRIVSMQSFERLDMRRLDQFVGRCGAIDKAAFEAELQRIRDNGYDTVMRR